MKATPTVKTLNILFMDLAGWSKLTTSQITEYLERCLPTISEAVTRREPFFLNTWGDALVAVFDSPVLAANCALDLRDLFRRASPSEGVPVGLKPRVSLHVGPVTMAYNPLLDRNDIFGEPIHLAARLEPVTTAGHVFCTQAFADSLKSLKGAVPDAHLLGDVALPKGYGVVPVFAVTGPGEEPPSRLSSATKYVDCHDRTETANIVIDVLGLNNNLPVKLVFHCVQHTADPREWEPKPVTGGLSALASLIEEIGRLSRMKRVTDSPYNTLSMPPPNIDVDTWLRRFCFNSNVVFLDAPFNVDSKGKKIMLNWAAARMMDFHLVRTCTDFTIAMKPMSEKDRARHPEECKKIVAGRKSFFADGAFDRGLVVRAKNPFCPGAAVIVVAGLHAPATHAGSLALCSPSRLEELYAMIGHTNRSEAPYFQAVYACPRQKEYIDIDTLRWEDAKYLICR